MRRSGKIVRSFGESQLSFFERSECCLYDLDLGSDLRLVLELIDQLVPFLDRQIIISRFIRFFAAIERRAHPGFFKDRILFHGFVSTLQFDDLGF